MKYLKYLQIIEKLVSLFEAFDRAESGEKQLVKGVRVKWKGATYVFNGDVQKESR